MTVDNSLVAGSKQSWGIQSKPILSKFAICKQMWKFY